MGRQFNNYLLAMGFTGIVIGLLVVANLVILYRAGEMLPDDELFAAHRSENTLINQAMLPVIRYKEKMYARNPADLVIIGSSTSLTFRRSMFSEKMYNWGGTAWGPEDAAYVMSRVFSIHRPKIILLNVDLFGLCDTPNEIGRPVQFPDKAVGTHAKNPGYTNYVFPVFDQMIKGRISIPQYLKLLFTGYSHAPAQEKFVGIFAKLFHTGFAKDGSLVSVQRSVNLYIDPLENRWRPLRGYGRFSICAASSYRLAMLRLLVARAQAAGTKVIGVLPPYAPTTMRNIRDFPALDRHLLRLRKIVSTIGFDEFFDLTDPADIDASSCEFADNIHFGDLIAMRMLIEMRARGSNLLKSFVHPETLEKRVAANRNKIFVAIDDYMKPLAEILDNAFKNSRDCGPGAATPVRNTQS